MGSGCSHNTSGWFQKMTPDSSIRYTGPSVTALGVCTGDTLPEIEGLLLQKVLDYATGIGITIPGIDLSTGPCAALFVDDVSCCQTCIDLPCIIEAYYDAICTTYSDVLTLQTAMAGLQGPFNVGCLTGVTPNSTLGAIVTELISEFCNLVTAFNTLSTTVGGFTAGINTTIGNFLATHISSCQSQAITITGTGASTQLGFKGFVPIGGILPYGGPANVFDATGLGNANGPCCGFALCNGQNGTIDMTGQTPVGALGLGGSVPAGFPSTPVGSRIPQGEVNHTLGISEVPPSPISGAGFTINDPGHDHALYYQQDGAASGGDTAKINPYGPNNSGSTWFNWATGLWVTGTQPGGGVPAVQIGVAKTGITISGSGSTSGGGGAHNNMQPSTALLYIQRVS